MVFFPAKRYQVKSWPWVIICSVTGKYHLTGNPSWSQPKPKIKTCHTLATGLHLLSREQRKPRGERAWTILAINVTIDINECKHRGYGGGKEKIDVRPSGQIIFPRIHHKIYFLLCIFIIWNNARNFLYLVFKGRRTVGLKGGRLGIKISLYSYSGLTCDFLFPHFPC